MVIQELRLENFRSYSRGHFNFSDTVTIISGPNGSGKTNLLEAVYYLGLGKSFRDSDEDLIKHSRDFFEVSGKVDDTTRAFRVLADNNETKKQFSYESEVRGRFTSRYRLPIVLFEPDDLLLLHGSPGKRRSYIDSLLSRLSPGYTSTLRRYERALAQRNRLLKQTVPSDEDMVFVWDITLAEEAATIYAQRQRLVEAANIVLSEYYSQIAGKEHTVIVQYNSSVDGGTYKQSLIHHLKARFQRDCLLGFTSVGPHRDDIEFIMNDQPMENNASRGEVRSLLLAIKRFEAAQLQEVFETAPLLLLDDVFSELDCTRRKQLTKHFYDHQMIITTTNADVIRHNRKYLVIKTG